MSGKPTVRMQSLGCLTLLLSSVATTAELSAVSGHYHYEQYAVTLPNGRVLALKDLGATDAFLDISEMGTITLRMTMSAGNTVTETAKVIEAHFAQGKGFWIAQWPDMSYPVTAQLTISSNTLIKRYEI